jgi:hypothetical protein
MDSQETDLKKDLFSISVCCIAVAAIEVYPNRIHDRLPLGTSRRWCMDAFFGRDQHSAQRQYATDDEKFDSIFHWCDQPSDCIIPQISSLARADVEQTHYTSTLF